MFVPDYVNDLVKVVVIFGVIHHATTPAHNIFCYSAVAHILTPSVNLPFRPNRVLKINIGLGPGPGFITRPIYNSVWVCRPGPTRGV